jgi:hypothetical protein
VLVDSDLDWGQDVKRLAARLREAGAQQVFFTPMAYADLAAQGLPPVKANSPFGPSPGWNAVSLSVLRKFWLLTQKQAEDRTGNYCAGALAACRPIASTAGLGDSLPEVPLWPDQVKPPERIGKSIWLWYFPPAR